MNFSSIKIPLLIILGAALLFIPFLGMTHLFDWDEINFAECAREMIASHNYSTPQINFYPFWEKPPLFIWFQALSMHTFGINEFAARLPNAVCGIFTLLILFRIGRKIYDQRFALLWVLVYAGSILPQFYFKSGIIDPWFNLFIFLGIYYFLLYTNDTPDEGQRPFFNRNIFLSALWIALGVMTKGPVAAIVFALVFMVLRILARKPIQRWNHFFLFSMALILLGGAWFIILLFQGKTEIILDFMAYQVRLFTTEDAAHGGPFYYHWIILLFGCFPASVFAIRGFFRQETDTPFQKHMKRGMIVLFWVVLILFSIVKTKIVHYSSLCYFPLTFLGAYTCYKLLNREISWKKWMSALLLFLGGIIGIAFSALQFLDTWKEQIISGGFMKDQFGEACFRANVHWQGWEFLIGALMLAAVFVSAYKLHKGRPETLWFLFALTLIVTNLSIVVLTSRVEGYSQRAAISFYESLKGKDCYVGVTKYKSYAHLFYTDKPPGFNQSPLFQAYLKEHLSWGIPAGQSRTELMDDVYYQWLQEGPVIDKPAYIVCKNIHAAEFMKEHPVFKRLCEQNGFVFFRRDP